MARRWITHAALIVACALAVVMAAVIQHIVFLGLEFEELSARLFVTPCSVGTIFGIFLVRQIRLSQALRQSSTKLLKSEGDVRHLNQQLTNTVEQRTRALRDAETQLVHAQKMEALGRLAGGVAHDSNNLLTVILGTAEALTMGAPSPAEIREGATQIVGATQRASALNKQLLLFSRKQVAMPSVVDLAAVVTDLSPMLERMAGERIELRLHTEQEARIWCDRGQIEQVVMNLVVNARDAITDGGTIEVSVNLVNSAEASLDLGPNDSRRQVQLVVRDDGCGIKENTLHRVFEPFFTTKSQGSGTGLGLSVVYGIVERFDGKVVAQSTPGEGTTFTVLLPQTVQQPHEREHAPRAPQGEAAGEEILLIENDDTVRAFLFGALSNAGYRVYEAHSVAAAHKEVAQLAAQLSLVVCDVVLGDGLGIDVAESLALTDPSCPVLFITGHIDADVAHRISEHSRWPVLEKPFTLNTLLEQVRMRMRSKPRGS